ncbi:MAG: prepilin-type N-terminal cleavage/methylation domain-containing protein [Bdellovibrionales bacterium]|nr:prepilin-type N-terminal cleavage/methylation domain-containing protein [Bdellovibrionales bacterium]
MNSPFQNQMRRRGFTLIELMMAVLILTIIASYSGSTLYATFRTQRLIDQKTQLNDVGIAISQRLTEDLSQIFFVESYQKLTYLKLRESGGRPVLSFTALSHASSSPDARESDQCEVTYRVDTSKGQKKTNRLLRKEKTFLDGYQENEEDEGFTELTNNLSEISIELSLDGEKWENTWDSMSPAFANKVPKLARIRMVLSDEQERTQSFESFVEIPLSENLSLEQKKEQQNTQKNSSQDDQKENEDS